MNSYNRTIRTGLTGSINHEILNSVMGQLSDGIWENTSSMRKYWENAEVELDGQDVVLIIDFDSGSGFHGKTDDEVKAWFADKIKQIAKEEMGDHYGPAAEWNRSNNTVLDYLGSNAAQVTVADAYRAYDTLKGRDAKKLAKTAEGKELRRLAIQSKQLEIICAEQKLEQLKKELAAL
jgi:hypothetical protein